MSNNFIDVSCQFRANPVEEISEIGKLKCLPFLRALILSGKNIIVVTIVTTYHCRMSSM